MRKSIVKLSSVLGAAALMLFSCSSNSNGKLKIAATFAPIYDYVARIAGDKAEIMNVVGDNEPHEFSLNDARSMGFIEKADLLFAYGHNIDQWADGLNQSAYRNVTEGLRFKADGGVEDPHAWLSIECAKSMARNVARAISEKDPANKEYYENNLESLLESYDGLDAKYKETLLGKTASPYIVTSHEAFGYLASDYGLTQVGVNDIADHEPTSARISQVVDFIEEHEVKCIFLEELDSAGNIETVKSELSKRGYEIGYDVLSAYECATESEWKNGDDFVSVMEENLKVLAKWIA